MARPNRKNPWTSTSEVLLWILVVALLFPAAFAGYAVGHYTSLGKPQATVTVVADGTVTTPTTTGATTTTAATTTTTSGGDQVAAGKLLFSSNGCDSCHTFTPANATGQVGPNLDSAIAADAQADKNMALDAFIKQSITDPSAYLAKGYTGGIMPSNFGKILKPAQIDDLVAFILSGTK